MKTTIYLMSITVFSTLVLLAPTLMAQNPTPAEFPDMHRPKAVHTPMPTGTCAWWTSTDNFVQNSSEDGPHYNGGLLPGGDESDADARTRAAGMEIWASAYAYDELWGWVATAATSTAGNGSITLRIVKICPSPLPRITLDWAPTFTLRVGVVDSNAAATVGGVMSGSCNELNVNTAIFGALQKANTLTAVTLALGGLTIPLTVSQGIGALQQSYSDLKHAIGNIPEATCIFNGSTSASVEANDYWGRAECFAKCRDSTARIDLDGFCQNCGGHSYIEYGLTY